MCEEIWQNCKKSRCSTEVSTHLSKKLIQSPGTYITAYQQQQQQQNTHYILECKIYYILHHEINFNIFIRL